MNKPKRFTSLSTQKRLHWSVSDGRTAVGKVELRHGVFVAIDLAGHAVGSFSTLHEAARALETVPQVND
jgi:hypothetical protein